SIRSIWCGTSQSHIGLEPGSYARCCPEACSEQNRWRQPRLPSRRFCLDAANSLGRPETFRTVVENLAEHAVVFHAKDYDIRRIDTRMGFSIVGTPVGDGRVDFDWVLSEIRRRGRGGI